MYRRRAKRTMRRSRRKRASSRRRASKSKGVASKAYVQKAISRKMESKMVQVSNQLYWNTVDELDNLIPYQLTTLYKYCTNGTTDRGRIGNTIFATKIVVKYKIRATNFADDPEKPDELPIQSLPPIYFKFFLVKRKSGTGSLAEGWFNSKDRGQEFPIESLNFSDIQNGLNTINVADKIVLKYKSVRCKLTRDNRSEIITGSMSYVFPKIQKITLNENSTNVVDDRLINPNYALVMYPYWGTDSAWGSDWGIQYSIQQYYKD